jgi:hypothetical protein
VVNEFTLATLAYNITRLHAVRAARHATGRANPSRKQITAPL